MSGSLEGSHADGSSFTPSNGQKTASAPKRCPQSAQRIGARRMSRVSAIVGSVLHAALGAPSVRGRPGTDPFDAAEALFTVPIARARGVDARRGVYLAAPAPGIAGGE